MAAPTHTPSLHTSPLDTRPYTLHTTSRHLPLRTLVCRLTRTPLFVDVPACLRTDRDTLGHVHMHSHFYSILSASRTLTPSTQLVMHTLGSLPINVNSASTSTPRHLWQGLLLACTPPSLLPFLVAAGVASALSLAQASHVLYTCTQASSSWQQKKVPELANAVDLASNTVL